MAEEPLCTQRSNPGGGTSGTPGDPSPKPQGGAEPPRSDPHPSGRILAVRARGSPPLGPFFATSDPILAVFSTKMCFEIGSFRDKNVFRSTIHPGPTKIVDFGGLNAMQRHVTPFSVDFGRGYGESLAPPTPGAPGVPPPLGPGTCCGSRGVGPYSTRVAVWSPRGARGPPPLGLLLCVHDFPRPRNTQKSRMALRGLFGP